MYFIIPLIADNLNYKYTISLEGKTFTFCVKYNGRMERWTLDIQDYRELPIISGIVLSMGVDILAKYAQSDLPLGSMYMYSTSGLYDECELDSPGVTHFLIYRESTTVDE